MAALSSTCSILLKTLPPCHQSAVPQKRSASGPSRNSLKVMKSSQNLPKLVSIILRVPVFPSRAVLQDNFVLAWRTIKKNCHEHCSNSVSTGTHRLHCSGETA